MNEQASGRWSADESGGDDCRVARLILVRHGESEWNAEGRIQGQGGTGLSARGEAQAVEVAEHLAVTYPDPHLVVSSDQERVVQTSQPYLSRTGRTAEFDKRLREIDSGVWTGLLTTEVAERYPDQIAAVRRGEDIARGGGENFAAMRSRVAEALHDLARLARTHVGPGETMTAIVFTHGGPIRVAVADALGLPPNGHRLLDPPRNCSVTILNADVGNLDDETGRFRLEGYNSTGFIVTPSGKTSYDAVGERR
ncbi:histidine phosphatase family protein [Phytoactinopolyspora halotolerans]|uniref:Histidine phosphatase family protein n=1 Tax=Phytoactinopolyspora halotolerans TaxID=1981512 RepID=A0A6L9SG14_9ACTN|nr:histidine phosphatase family protein [Phytoactinopolyspora halotolerans]NEE04295.1 histidine phosphatase family protein [Phytoactinopolyspora halotolerans]